MTDTYEDTITECSIDEAVVIIGKAIERKTSELVELQKKAKRVRKAEKLDAINALSAYIQADINAYKSVIADMKDDPTYLEGVDLDAEPVPVPEGYQAYIDGLSVEDLENEMDAESLRADYCDTVIEEICTNIGKKALKSKKMVKALLDDPYVLEQLGEVIFYDDYLFDLFKTLSAEKEEKKKKKRKD